MKLPENRALVDDDMKVFMERLSRAVYKELKTRNVSVSAFSDLRGLSRNTVFEILDCKKKEMMLSTLFQLSIGTNIYLPELFGCDRKVGDVTVEIGGKRYFAHLIRGGAGD